MMNKLLRLPQVMDLVGLRRTEIYRRISNGTFPSPVHLGARAVAWVESDIEAWIAQRIAASREAAK